MNQKSIDLRILDSEEDSRFSLIRVKLKSLEPRDIDYTQVSKCGFCKGTIRDWLAGRSPIALRVIKKRVNSEDAEYLCLRGGKNKTKIPKLNEDLAYLSGVIFGDGHIRNKIRNAGYRMYRIVLDNEVTPYSREYLPNLIKNIFGIKPTKSFRIRKSRIIRLDIPSKIITRIFTNVLGFSYGKKQDTPIDYAKKWPEKLQLRFIAGLFDTDGGRSWGSYMFGNTSIKAVNFVNDFLHSKEISTKIYRQVYPTSVYYHLFILKKDKEKFLRLIPVKNMSKFS